MADERRGTIEMTEETYEVKADLAAILHASLKPPDTVYLFDPDSQPYIEGEYTDAGGRSCKFRLRIDVDVD